jgi:hypothetical protein
LTDVAPSIRQSRLQLAIGDKVSAGLFFMLFLKISFNLWRPNRKLIAVGVEQSLRRRLLQRLNNLFQGLAQFVLLVKQPHFPSLNTNKGSNRTHVS